MKRVEEDEKRLLFREHSNKKTWVMEIKYHKINCFSRKNSCAKTSRARTDKRIVDLEEQF